MKVVAVAATFLAAAACTFASTVAHSQAYPSKPVFIVMPYAPGSGSDAFVRVVAQRLTESWGSKVAVDNKPGANSIIGTEYVTKAAPDGYTLLIATPALVLNPLLYAKLPFDTFKDLASVASLVTLNMAVAVTPSLPAGTMRELLDLAKARPSQLTYASLGNGSTQHLVVEMLQSMADVQLLHVPYKNSPFPDLVAGHVQIHFASIGSVLPYVKSGKLRMLAITSAKRAPQFPDLPAIAETVPGYEASTWYGLSAPAGIPRNVSDRINGEINKMLADSSFRTKALDPIFFEPFAGSSAQFAAFISAESAKWGNVIRAANVKLD